MYYSMYICMYYSMYICMDVLLCSNAWSDIPYYVGCVNLSFAYVEGESLLMAMKTVALSSGRSVLYEQTLAGNASSCIILCSACTSASLEPSYVLRAIGADEDLAHSSIRYISTTATVLVYVCPLLR